MTCQQSRGVYRPPLQPLWRFGTRLLAESAGHFGTCPTLKPAKRPTSNTCHFGAVIAGQVCELACKALNSRAAGPGCVFCAESIYSVAEKPDSTEVKMPGNRQIFCGDGKAHAVNVIPRKCSSLLRAFLTWRSTCAIRSAKRSTPIASAFSTRSLSL